MLFVDRHMERVEVHPVAGGLAAVFSLGERLRNGPNEDAAAVLPAHDGCVVLAVADGVGGHPGGANASRAALQALRRALTASPEKIPLRNAMLTGFENANRDVARLPGGGATTLAAAKIEGGRLRPFHVGDSAIVVVGQRGKRKLETLPHSPVGYAVEAGLLDENEAMHHEERHVISNAVGTPSMRIEVGAPVQVAACDTVLLATDGLLDNLFMEEIIDTIRAGPLEESAQRLADRCLRRMENRSSKPRKPDDVTFIAYRRT